MKHVLVIENEASIRKALKIGLSRPGWIIDTVLSNIVCVTDLVHRYQYDIIIVDLDTEETTILDLIREIKHDDSSRIIIGMTRKSAFDSFSENNTEFVSACYQKPLHLDMLKKAIDLELKKLA